MSGLSGLYLVLAIVMGSPVSDPAEVKSPVVFVQGLVRGTPQVVLDIRADGTWSTMAGPGGKLTPDEVAQLQAASDKADVTVTRLQETCPPVAMQSHWVEAGPRRVSWGACQVPHKSIFALIALAESLTTRRPPAVLIKLQRHHSGQPESTRETFAVMRSGAWTTHNGRGTLTAGQLAELIALVDATLIEAPPTPIAPNCRSGYLHHLEVPGRGEVRWAPPCYEPSDTLGATLVYAYGIFGWKM